jgi:hypothetical protein
MIIEQSFWLRSYSDRLSRLCVRGPTLDLFLRGPTYEKNEKTSLKPKITGPYRSIIAMRLINYIYITCDV